MLISHSIFLARRPCLRPGWAVYANSISKPKMVKKIYVLEILSEQLTKSIVV